MPFCSDCERRVSNDNEFRPECGKRLIKPQSVRQEVGHYRTLPTISDALVNSVS